MSVADGPWVKLYSGASTAHKPPKASLPIGQSVRFRVRASNAVGPGPMSGPSMPFVPLPPLPPPSPSPSADGRLSSRASSPVASPGPGSIFRPGGPGARGRGGFAGPASPRGGPASPLSFGNGSRGPFAGGQGLRQGAGSGYASPGGSSGSFGRLSAFEAPSASVAGSELAPEGSDAGAAKAAAAAPPAAPAVVVVADAATCKRVASRQSWRKLMRKHKIDQLMWPLIVTAVLSIVLLRAVLFGGSSGRVHHPGLGRR